ncbi:hypothetical protein QE372_004514 [Agrobacterium pusense]|nr:hypothetical protein [Agrobacterium pusense]OAI82173.1 hypothetical protein AYO27_19395 [Rhizobium sp. GHKF11]
MLLQNADDLFFCKTIALLSLVFSMGQTLVQIGLFRRSKVTTKQLAGMDTNRMGNLGDDRLWLKAGSD